jgi:hypothetical protein
MKVKYILIGACAGIGVSIYFANKVFKKIFKDLNYLMDTTDIDETIIYYLIQRLIDLGYFSEEDSDDIVYATRNEIFKDLVKKYGDDRGRDKYYELFKIKPQNLA